MQTPSNMNTDPSGGSFSKAADQVMQGLSAMYKACHQGGHSEICDQITGLMQATAEVETAYQGGGEEPLPADQLEAEQLPPGEEPPVEAGPPVPPEVPLPEEGPEPLPEREATSIGDAAGMLHEATQAGAAKRRLRQGL